MERTTIDLGDDCLCELVTDFLALSERTAVMEKLLREVPFEARTLHLFGRDVLEPRLVAWIGDAEAVYTYSRRRHEPLSWTPTLALLRDRVVQATGELFNAVLCNLYRDGRDSMGMHADKEPELGPRPVIASLSLGETRTFRLRRRKGGGQEALDLPLTDGSLLVMRGDIQHKYRHGIPKEPKVTRPRINLTFRRILVTGR